MSNNGTMTFPACHAAALEYLLRGWAAHALCPPRPDHATIEEWHHDCKTPGKRPIGKWKGLQERLPTIEEVDRQFGNVPLANVGIVLGPVSNLVRLDVDGEAGKRAFQKLCGELPGTVEFTTPSGRGLLFRIPAGAEIKTTVEKGECIGGHQELRFQAKGAQTVVPPSRAANGVWAWVPGRSPDEVEVALLPENLVKLMAPRPKMVQNKNKPPNGFVGKATNFNHDDDGAIALKALAALRPSRADGYDDWLNVGMILHSVDQALLDAWDQWSASSMTYQAGVCAAKWRSFTAGGGLGLGTLIKWARADSPGFRSRRQVASPGQPGSSGKPTTVVGVILDYLRQEYAPTHKRGANIWSSTLGREVARSEACKASKSNLFPALLAAADFPRDKNGVTPGSIPRVFTSWSPFAWNDLLASISTERH